MRVTLTPGITPPVASLTVPVIWPVAVCALNVPDRIRRANTPLTNADLAFTFIIGDLLCEFSSFTQYQKSLIRAFCGCTRENRYLLKPEVNLMSRRIFI